MSREDLPKIEVIYNPNKTPCKNCKCADNTGEDKSLRNWKTWMDIRKDVHKNLSDKVDRDSGELLMNASEELRQCTEEKLLFTYTNIMNKPDPYRGCPSFWNLPIALYNKRGDKKPTHFAVQTKEQRCIVPDIEYVNVPNLIKSEKHIVTNKRIENKLWKKSKYRRQRKEELTEHITEIEPHKPIGDLLIIGKSIHCKATGEITEEPNFEIHSEGDYNTGQISVESLKPLFAVNEVVFIPSSYGIVDVNVFLDYDIASLVVVTEYLKIINHSNKALRFTWSKVYLKNNFQEYNMSDRNYKHGFFFNFNEFIVIPNSTVNIPIYFKTKSSGIFKDTWQLMMNPNIINDDLIIHVKLNCVATFSKYNEISMNIKEKIQMRARDRIINESLRKMVTSIPLKYNEYTVYNYDKATLFEAINSSFNPVNLRPKYLYNKAIVTELEAFYASVRLDRHPMVWNLSLETLRKVTHERDISNKEIILEKQSLLLKEKIAEADATRLVREELRQKRIQEECKKAGGGDGKKSAKGKGKGTPKPKSPKAKGGKKGKKGKASTADVRDVVVPLVKREVVERTLGLKLEDIIKKLHQPTTWLNEQKQKLSVAYTLFCAYFDRLEEEIEQLNRSMDRERISRYPGGICAAVCNTPVRMISEYHDETIMQNEKFFESCGSASDKRAEPWVDEIPVENYEKRYRAFHCIADTPKSGSGKGSKGSKGGKKKDKKKDKKDKSSKKSDKAKSDKSAKSKIEPTITCTVIEYDPFADVPPKQKLPSVLNLSTKTSRTSVKSFASHRTSVSHYGENNQEVYENNLYLIVYNNLSLAIDDLEAMLILQTKLTATHNIIKKVNDSYVKESVDNQETIRIVDLRRIVSEELTSKDIPKELLAPEKKPRPCYASKTKEKEKPEYGATSDTSLWDILQKPRPPPKTPEPDEYLIIKDINDTTGKRDLSTSVTNLGAVFYDTPFKDVDVQVDVIDLPRNEDCAVYCNCDCEEDTEEVHRSTVKKKVQSAGDNLYPELLIEGTNNFRFYNSDEELEVVVLSDCDSDEENLVK